MHPRCQEKRPTAGLCAAATLGLLVSASAPSLAETRPDFDSAVDLLTARHGDYLAAGSEPEAEFPAGHRVIGVQIERNELGLRLGGLSFPNLFEALYKRHGEAAAFILNRTADVRSETDIPVYNVTDGFFDFPTGDFRRIVEAADVVSLSQIAKITRGENGAFTGATSSYATSDGIETLRGLWAGTDTMVFHAIGNDAAAAQQDYPESNLNWIFNDLYVRVGTGHARPDGSIAVDANSPPHAVTVLTEIPEYHYRLFTEPQSAFDRTYSYLERNRSFYESALIRAITAGAFSPFNLGYCRGKSEAELPFEGRDLLDRPTFEQASAPLSEIFRAYSTCASETLESYYAARNRDPAQAYNLRAIGGTSFSAPEAAGMFLAALERHPELGKHDLLTAMILSARPADAIAAADGGTDSPVTNRANGRGLFRSRAAGFGYVDWDGFAARAEAISALKRARPALTTTERDISSDVAVYRGTEYPPLHGMRSYPIEVDDDSLFTRGVLILSFGDRNRNIPAEITLVDPQGGETILSPSRYSGGSGLVMAGTDAFFGVHSAGTWHLRVPEAFSVTAAALSIEGVEAGPDSLIERFLTDQGYPAAGDVQIAAPLVSEPNL